MFGFGKKKILDEHLLIKNIINAVIEVWTDDTTLGQSGLSKSSLFSEAILSSEAIRHKIVVEKLRLVFGFALISLTKSNLVLDMKENLFHDFEAFLKNEDDHKITNLSLNGLQDKAEVYAKVFLEKSPKEAGEYTEALFARRVFGLKLEDLDTNEKYLLYKQLSNLQRKTIMQISTAMRSSFVRL